MNPKRGKKVQRERGGVIEDTKKKVKRKKRGRSIDEAIFPPFSKVQCILLTPKTELEKQNRERTGQKKRKRGSETRGKEKLTEQVCTSKQQKV